MSSPLPRLKRARRTPLWSNATSFKKDEKHNTADHKTPASITPSFGFAASNISQSTHDQIIKGIMQGKTPNDDCLLSSMAARLSMVERGLLSSKREIIEKVIIKFNNNYNNYALLWRALLIKEVYSFQG